MEGATVRSENQKGKIASRMGRRNLKTCVGIEIRSGAADVGIRREGTGDNSVMEEDDLDGTEVEAAEVKEVDEVRARSKTASMKPKMG